MSLPGGAPVLQPGVTCWRLAHADRFAVIIDAAPYFAHLKAAILAARHSILLIGWDFDPRVQLVRTRRPRNPRADQVGRLLSRAMRRNPELRVHVLRWDLAFLKMPVRGTTSALMLDWSTSDRLAFRMDGHHPAGACHHQKIAVIDDALAFCGGIDVTGGRWDTPEHLDDAPRRRWPGGARHGPWHDATTAVDGAAAAALGDLARERWLAATGETLAPPPRAYGDRWPPALAPTLTDVKVGIARTDPGFGGTEAAREIEALYLAAIASARRSIYLESQYFAGHRIADAIAARLAEPDGPEVVIVNPRRADGWLEEQAMGSARAFLLARLRAADTHHRLRFATPVTAAGRDIYVHAKVLVVDDTLIRVGSSNINNRSMGLDTECDLAVEVVDAGARAAVTRVRDTLMAEHLGVPPATFARALAAADGSLARTFDRLVRRSGKTLVPFEPPELTEAARALGETALLDPDRPEPIAETALRAWQLLPPVRYAAMALGTALAGVGGWLVWRARTRDGAWRRRALHANAELAPPSADEAAR